jgi:flagellar biosynthetic protein FliR
VLAVELIFPILVALMLTDIALGVLSKVAPQFGIFQVGLQIKVGLALGAIALTMPLLLPRLHALFGGMVGVSVAVLR